MNNIIFILSDKFYLFHYFATFCNMTEKTDQVLFEVIYMIHLIFNRIRFFQEFCASSLLVQKLFYQCEYEDIKHLLSLPSAKYAYIYYRSERVLGTCWAHWTEDLYDITILYLDKYNYTSFRVRIRRYKYMCFVKLKKNQTYGIIFLRLKLFMHYSWLNMCANWHKFMN